jgi:cell division protein FtsW
MKPQLGYRPLGVFALALAMLCALQLACLLRAPAAWLPGLITVTLQPGQSIRLGRDTLAAPLAGREQVGVRRDDAGRWWVSSLDAGRALTLQRSGHKDQHSGAVALAAGNSFQLGARTFRVVATKPHALDLDDGAHRWHYDGTQLSRDGAVQPPCPDASPGARFAWAWNRLAPRVAAFARPLQFGGNLHCGMRLGVPGTTPSSAAISMADGGALLSSAGIGPLLLSGPGGPVEVSAEETALDRLSAVVAGRTRLLVTRAADTLALQPIGHVALFARPDTELPPQVRWNWRQRSLWTLTAPPAWWTAVVAAAACAAAVFGWSAAAAAPPRARLSAFARGAAGPAIACAGAGALVLQRLGMPPGAGPCLLLAWCALWYALLAPRRFSVLAGAAVLLLAAGLLAQLELGLGAMESSWLRHAEKTAALAALGLGAGIRFAIVNGKAPVRRQRFEILMLGAAALALLALLLQVAVGSETGVFDLQPVELAKPVLAALCAYCLALAVDTERDSTVLRWLRLLAPAVLFVALLAVALVQVDDFSPLVLLLVWGMCMALAWTVATRRRGASLAIAGVACAAVLAVAGLRAAGVAEAEHLGFYADRFLVWLDPATHPHTGRQLLLGARAIASGGWFGADGMLGLLSLGQPLGEVLRIPAVQDDFAPSFFIQQHGLASAVLLWAVQALFLCALVHTAARAWLDAASSRDFRHAWFARFRCFALCGGAAFVLGHLLLSWGTNLSIFPVMGQPMSFLSAGGSHLLFFICPLLALGAASAQTIEEI